MSEYPMSSYNQNHKKASYAPKQEGPTLFDDDIFMDDAVERIVDAQGVSYEAARRLVGAEARSYSPEVKDGRGAAVELGARAVALETVMDAYNQLNKNMGVSKIRQYDGNPFDSRYRNPSEVRENMGVRAATKLHVANDSFDTLTAKDDLLEQGFSTEDVNRVEQEIKKSLLNRYGPGKTYAPDRAKVVRKARTAARKGSQGK